MPTVHSSVDTELSFDNGLSRGSKIITGLAFLGGRATALWTREFGPVRWTDQRCPEAGHVHLAHADQANDVCRVPSILPRLEGTGSSRFQGTFTASNQSSFLSGWCRAWARRQRSGCNKAALGFLMDGCRTEARTFAPQGTIFGKAPPFQPVFFPRMNTMGNARNTAASPDRLAELGGATPSAYLRRGCLFARCSPAESNSVSPGAESTAG
jgi:hypothetical protein